jgi:ribonucleotide reductase beta subunit family protein with ferritin-like domain
MPLPIQTPKEAYVFDYPQIIEFCEEQEKIFWPSKEINVSKDIQSLRVRMSPSQYHGIVSTLRLFTKYELFVGNEYWMTRFVKQYPRPEFQRAGALFSCMELNSHAPFYNEINVALNLATEDFDPVLSERMSFIGNMVEQKESDLLSTAVFSLIEGAILYSSFAFLKSFQANGMNELLNVVRGINFSVRDENIHHELGAWTFRQHLAEAKAAGMTAVEEAMLESRIIEAAQTLAKHEFLIIDKIFEKGEMPNANADDMKVFVYGRINLCLKNLGYNAIFPEDMEDPVAEWFYRDINLTQFNDIFTGIGREYKRDWDMNKLMVTSELLLEAL